MLSTIHILIVEDIARLAHTTQSNVMLNEQFKVIGIAQNGKDLQSKILELPHLPDVVLMDIKMPLMNGIEATAWLKQQHPQVKVIMMTVFDDEQAIFESILHGADGYLLKDETPLKLHQAILDVMTGGSSMSPSIARKALLLLKNMPVEALPTQREDFDISPRELEVLEQLGQGLTYARTAENLHISEGTVRKHIEHIYQKLKVNNKTAAVSVAKKLGLI